LPYFCAIRPDAPRGYSNVPPASVVAGAAFTPLPLLLKIDFFLLLGYSLKSVCKPIVAQYARRPLTVASPEYLQQSNCETLHPSLTAKTMFARSSCAHVSAYTVG
jgi:hypothetical protein